MKYRPIIASIQQAKADSICGQSCEALSDDLRLDRLTGVTQVCFPDVKTMPNPDSLASAKFICEVL